MDAQKQSKKIDIHILSHTYYARDNKKKDTRTYTTDYKKKETRKSKSSVILEGCVGGRIHYYEVLHLIFSSVESIDTDTEKNINIYYYHILLSSSLLIFRMSFGIDFKFKPDGTKI